jgi:undecaprenyl diphosphate synthase
MNLKDINLNHIAIIMDGNGRWATNKGLERTAGHAAGEFSLSRSIDWALKNNLQWLTVYAFSTENWSRSDDEVDFLMFFNRDILIRRREEFNDKGVRFHFIGDLEDNRIPDENKFLMNETEQLTKNNKKLNLVFAFNYGSRKEIHDAYTKLNKNSIDQLDEKSFRANLLLPEMPDPDLLIRTAGEKRVSNFLLYQLSYTELMFVDTLWPDFDEKELDSAVDEFQNRVRKYGNA